MFRLASQSRKGSAEQTVMKLEKLIINRSLENYNKQIIKI